MESVESTTGAETAATPAADLFDDLSFLLARANALSLAAGNAALGAYGLRVRSYSVLALAAGGRRPSQRELAELLRLDPSQVVALVDDLQARGPRHPRARPRRPAGERRHGDGRGSGAVRAGDGRGRRRPGGRLRRSLAEERGQLATLLRRIAIPARGGLTWRGAVGVVRLRTSEPQPQHPQDPERVLAGQLRSARRASSDTRRTVRLPARSASSRPARSRGR